MITATNLTKNFGSSRAVDDVSLTVNRGEIFGLLGPNAAGKTTVIRMLCGILQQDSGEITINSADNSEAKNDFGYVAQYFGQYEELTVWENLKFYARMYGITDQNRLEELLVHYNLDQFTTKLAGSLSGGFKRRLALCCALAHDPPVLFLDEPTAGIDPVTRKQLWDDFYDLSTQGKTLFVTTHYMEEAQRCTSLAFMAAGKVVAQGTPASIKDCLGPVQAFETDLAYSPSVHQALHGIAGIQLVNQFGGQLRIIGHNDLDVKVIDRTISAVEPQHHPIRPVELNLEDVFIALTQDQGIPQ